MPILFLSILTLLTLSIAKGEEPKFHELNKSVWQKEFKKNLKETFCNTESEVVRCYEIASAECSNFFESKYPICVSQAKLPAIIDLSDNKNPIIKNISTCMMDELFKSKNNPHPKDKCLTRSVVE